MPNDPSDLEPKDPPSRWRIISLVGLALLPVLVTALAQPFLPETVPLHYGTSGPDRWGPKSELFVAIGIGTVIGLVVASIFAMLEKQRETGREDWIVLDGPKRKASFPLFAGVLALLAVCEIAYVLLTFGTGEPNPEPNRGQLITDIVMGACLLAMWATAAYMISGKGRTTLINFHPGTSERERRTGDDKRQSRAIGVLLLFLSAIIVVEWVLLR